ncbi:6348_t:CDS:1 [Funneliformis geosporum]|uniref:18064_t:CDS:1 n=1 Tax=Funneliformis geosporum TaxID=1117311 RepID=A0A9W4SDJ8_9GLOM|nr:18064_t:CDS:1 [Funneliformis geosporum]CAI2166530.1 6348_t:CDS:1 [Funneliformis geosporum]
MTDNISKFLNETTSIEQKITNVRSNITKIEEFQSQILVSTSTTHEDSTNKEREAFVESTRNLLIECKDRIKKIQYENARIPSTDPNFGLRQQRYEYLRTKLSNVLEDYRLAENTFMKQTKDRMERQYKVVNPNASQQEIDDYVSNPNSQPIFQQALLRTNEAQNALAEVQKRHEDIKSIENTIAELVALFQELHLQVEEQDQTIVNIEANTEVTVEKTEQAANEIGTATKLAQAARKKKWICLGIAILIILVIVVVVITQLPKGSISSSSTNTVTATTTVTPTALPNNPSPVITPQPTLQPQ